ncbi:MAG TPA: hypothetical protein VJ916_07090 [Anaerovoracaceae bacterium]|nr:hypothetical protein [Anaerovoracaceae bacterium]
MKFVFTLGNDKYFLEMINNPIAIWIIRTVVITVFITVIISYIKYNRKK